MRILQSLLVVTVLALIWTRASAAFPPAPHYAWAQPGTAIVSTPYAQPPAWIFKVAVPTAPRFLMSGYVWAQPGTAYAGTPYGQPPAWIPM